ANLNVSARRHARCSSFFFFQAEDGIRDPLVTGVQTCALPILNARRRVSPSDVTRLRAFIRDAVYADDKIMEYIVRLGRATRAPRSEERRVGKECGWRGGPDC